MERAPRPRSNSSPNKQCTIPRRNRRHGPLHNRRPSPRPGRPRRRLLLRSLKRKRRKAGSSPLAARFESDTATIAFVDLAGFSAIADVYGDESAVDVLDRFERLVLEAMGASSAPMKWIGDEVMLAFATPEAALRALGRLLPACRLDPNIPLTRTAVHHGAVIRRRGDLFGATVNIAARIAARAEPGQILATAPVAEGARVLGIEVRDLGEAQLRSVASRTALFAIELAPASDPAWICPVCKMHAPYEAYQRTRPEGAWFCSERCAEAYAKAPHVYAAGSAARREEE